MMGEPSKYDYQQQQYPNQQVQQTPLPPQEFFQTTIEQPVKHSGNNIKDFIIYTGDLFGWFWMACFVITGAIVVAGFIFKTQIKKRFGDIIKAINEAVNK